MHEQSQFALISNEGNTAEIEETKDENSDRYIVKDQEMIQVNRNIGEFTIEGVKTTLPLFTRIMQHDVFRKGEAYTDFIAKYMSTPNGKSQP